MATRRPSYDQTALSPMEKSIAAIWARHLPNVVSARTIAPDDSFFDLGGHSLLAQYVLLDLHKDLQGTSVPISALFQKPTLRAFAHELERLQDPIGLNLESATETDIEPEQQEYYSNDRKLLQNSLPTSFYENSNDCSPKTVLITGATGFLGAHIVELLAQDQSRVAKVIIHVRAGDSEAGMKRIRNTCLAYGLEINDRVTCVPGDLAQPRLGISATEWEKLSKVCSYTTV
jgi:L-2-aminoadipate reductase